MSGGAGQASVVQMRHFIKSQKELIKEALEGTWLSPPKPLNLEDLIALRAEMSGAMYDAIVSFIRRKTGVKTEATRKEVKAAFDEFKFEYETGNFTSVDDKEVEDKEGKKSIKRVTTHGYYLRVKDPLAVLQQSAAVHAKEGRLAWPSCVPHNVYPVCVMLDAGGGEHQGSAEASVRDPSRQRAIDHAARCDDGREGYVRCDEGGVWAAAACVLRVESATHVCASAVGAASPRGRISSPARRREAANE